MYIRIGYLSTINQWWKLSTRSKERSVKTFESYQITFVHEWTYFKTNMTNNIFMGYLFVINVHSICTVCTMIDYIKQPYLLVLYFEYLTLDIPKLLALIPAIGREGWCGYGCFFERIQYHLSCSWWDYLEKY